MHTVAEFWDAYRDAILASVRPHTASGYEVAWRRRVRESFGHRALDSITTFEIEAVAATWQIKYSTKRDALACLSKIMRAAVKAGMVPVNPCRGVELGRQEEDPTGRALSRAEVGSRRDTSTRRRMPLNVRHRFSRTSMPISRSPFGAPRREVKSRVPRHCREVEWWLRRASIP